MLRLMPDSVIHEVEVVIDIEFREVSADNQSISMPDEVGTDFDSCRFVVLGFGLSCFGVHGMCDWKVSGRD